MDIIPDDNDNNWVDEDEGMHPLRSTLPVDQAQATDRRARVEEEVEPQPSPPNHAPNPAPPPRSHAGPGLPQPFPTLPPWNFGLGSAGPPGRLFPLFPSPTSSSGNGNNTTPHHIDTTANPHPQPTPPSQPDQDSAPGNVQQNAQEPRFQAHTFVLGINGTGRPVPIPPGAFSAMFNQFRPATPQSQAQTPQPSQPSGQPAGNHNQPGQPGDSGQIPPFVEFVAGGIGALPPFFATPFGPGLQPPADDPGNGGGPEPGRGAPAWAELFRAMLGGEPPEEREDPERAKKLVKGLERVPVGLVKRMMKVDSVPRACENSTGTDGGEVPGCAICWDSLLPEDPVEDVKLHSGSTTSTSEHPTEGSDSKPVVPGPTLDDDTSTAIICLPCSHVFHASCLTPWFSKPRHTTCPTCRFDVDPKNLTYTPPRRPRPTPATTTAPPNDSQPRPVPNSATASTNSPAAQSPAAHQGQDHQHLPPFNPVTGEGDHNPNAHVEPPLFIPDVFAAHPQRTFFDMFRGPVTPPTQDHNNGGREQPGHDHLPGNEAPDNRNSVPPPIFGFGFGPQQPPVFGPPPPPGHPTHDARTAAANTPHDHGNGPHPEAGPQAAPFSNFTHGVSHGHFQAPGIAVDFTLHVPPEQGLDPERISQAMQDQATAFLRFFAGGGRVPGMGHPTGPGPTPGPGGVNHGSEAPTEWMPPSAPGPTLRQRVEAKERQAGSRCDDPSCGIGPSDEDPFPAVFSDPNSPSIKRVGILKQGGGEAVCSHVLHPACLVSADRCAGWGEKDRPTNDSGEKYEVVSCPVCRSVGQVQREVWEEGAKALLV